VNVSGFNSLFGFDGRKKLSATEKEDEERGIYSNENSTVNLCNAIILKKFFMVFFNTKHETSINAFF